MSDKRCNLLAYLKDPRGSAAIEAAVCTPVFVILVFGIFQVGWTQHCLSNVRSVLKDASRALLLNPDMTEAQIQTYVNGHLTGAEDPEVTVTLVYETGDQGKIGTLTAEYVTKIRIPLMNPIPIESSTTVKTAMPIVFEKEPTCVQGPATPTQPSCGAGG